MQTLAKKHLFSKEKRAGFLEPSGSVIVSVCCQHDRISNHSGDTLLGMSVKVFSEKCI